MAALLSGLGTQALRQELKDRSACRSPVLRNGKKSLSDATGDEEEDDLTWCTDAFLHEIPKSDVHVHLDGSLRLETLVELARVTPGVNLPTEDIGELRESIFRESFASLEDYLAPFAFTVGVLQNASNLERVAYEFAVDNFREGVRYFEVRYAPQIGRAHV